MAVEGSVPTPGVIVPHLVVRDAAEAVDFYLRAFGAKILYRSPSPSGVGEHIHLSLWDSLIQVSTEEPAQRRERVEGALLASPETLSGSTCVFQIGVPDVDAAYKRAVDQGAIPALPPTDMFWGDRYGWVRDPFGHVWAMAQVKEILTPAEGRQPDACIYRATQFLGSQFLVDERDNPMKAFALLFLMALPLYSQPPAPAPQGAPAATPADPWASLAFLQGTWDAKAQGSAGVAASGSYTFRMELGSHILARHSATADCKGPSTFDCEHGDLLYVFQDAPGAPLKAIYFDNEGHVIHYDVVTPAPNSVEFVSEASRSGPQFRLVYELKGGVMSGKFQMHMPGQTEWKSYLEWSGAKK